MSKDDGEHKYIHFVRYTFDKLNFEHGNEQMENKIKGMSNELSSIKASVDTMNEHMLDMKAQMQ